MRERGGEGSPTMSLERSSTRFVSRADAACVRPAATLRLQAGAVPFLTSPATGRAGFNRVGFDEECEPLHAAALSFTNEEDRPSLVTAFETAAASRAGPSASSSRPGSTKIRVPQSGSSTRTASQIGIKPTAEALEYAFSKNLDLVEVAAQADPPVAGSWTTASTGTSRSRRRSWRASTSRQIHVKEIKLRPKIGVHDYETKKGHVVRFLNQRAKVKVTIMFRGRENPSGAGRDLLCGSPRTSRRSARSSQQPLLDGRNMVMVLGPTKNAGVKRDAERRRHAAERRSGSR